MASTIPASLRSADIGRYALRAAQLENAKPVIAYWCNFWIVNQIIGRGLHTSDDDVKLYITELMDKLEKVRRMRHFKSENTDNDTVMDAVAANAYVEQFGLEVLGRAEAAMKANKVTKQTADTFQAAATFLELCQIWTNPSEPEVAAKIKFSKYHAVRIIKAIKAGEDPNASNPVATEEDELEALMEETKQDDPEVQAIVGSLAARPGQPSVEEVPDDTLQPSQSPPVLPEPPTTFADVSAAHYKAEPTSPNAESDTEPGAPLNLPSAPETFASHSTSVPNLPDTPADIGARSPQARANSFHSFPPPSSIPPSSPPAASHDASSFYTKPTTGAGPPPPFVQSSSATVPVVSRPTPPSIPSPISPAPAPVASNSSRMNAQSVDDQAIALAQKHARWAVSALTFDDVNTAIKELKNSLRYLGAE
ncbi:DUF605-domain-containing protein [Aspergillus sclerotioniger CBS 115572]|uniref:DUF605-domain-containing protein n=1 Tax=Aspergillus sclerotioniger CBS 115572 TaxID=1450535 RepID=A0A317XDJ1_9EURO|nr:DUF605-domain-containing protein [Aspergillus sclerotioniger CBS 115572]PWY95677.1 DUF605-domain-containing protein [Aspergillus sclerotioniger CBS 115572]